MPLAMMSTPRDCKSPREKTPLVPEIFRGGGDLGKAYGFDSHATFVKPPHSDDVCLTDYEPMKLSSFRVFFLQRGTIMGNTILITEQLIIFVIFFACAAPVYHFFKDEAVEGKLSVRRFVMQQEPKMRAFAMIMTGLAAFLLSFYTGITVARWWAMRTGGVGAIKAATVDIELLLYQCVTKDPKVLSAVRRYSRSSLLLMMMWRRKQVGELKQILTSHELLEEHECDQLLKWKHCLHETIWAWQTAIINKLYKEGKIKSDQLYGLLLNKCGDGRQAVQLVHTHLAVRVPMQYVHLLGLLVKMHNTILAVIMGCLFGAACRNRDFIISIQLFARLLILPFLFNAILLINCDLADPFDGSEADFPVEIYQETLEKDCNGLISATQNLPDWIRDGLEADGA